MLSYYQYAPIHKLFEMQVEQSPDSVAVVFEKQEEVLTYQQLNHRANQLAHYLQTIDTGPEVLVGLCVERSLLAIVGILGILKAGGAYLPLDPNYPKERLEFMLEDSQASILLTQKHLVNFLPVKKARIICLDSDWQTIIAPQSSANPNSKVTLDNLAYVIYTSGSTGKPKGVLIPHAGIGNLAQEQIRIFDVQANSRVLQFASLSFDASVSEIFMALLAGATLVLATRDTLMPGRALLKLLREQQITTVTLPPSALAVLPTEELPDLRSLIVAGEACPGELINRWASTDRRFFNAYGPTEATVCTTIAECTPGIGKPPIGYPIANKQVYLLDEQLKPVDIGVPGEIYIGGLGLARGYLNRPELTAEKFICQENFPTTRLYKTGDLGRYLPDGSLEFLGRIDEQVKIRGHRIELGEIEAVLGQHPSVRQAAVTAREDIPGEKRLVAYVVPNSDCEDSRSENLLPSPKLVRELRNFLQEKLPDYMVPDRFMLLAALPITPNGKVDRKALPAPDTSRPELAQKYIPPRTPLEKSLAEIWAEVLGIELVGIEDNFLELGGQSLLAITIVSRIRDKYQVDLPMRSLFDLPTIAQLAQQIQTIRGKQPDLQAPPIVPVSRNQNLPLAFSQQRLWFFEQLVPGTAVSNDAADIRLPGLQDVAALEKSFNEIIRRHEIWRTTFEIVDGQPVQVIHPAPYIPLPVVDLQALPSSEREAEALRQASELARKPFDLTKLPLMRVILFRFSQTDYRLYLIAHHLIFDGISLCNVFLPELAALYEAFSQKKPNAIQQATQTPLAELSIQFADYACWQRQWLQDELLAPQIEYWKKQLAHLSMLQLPTDRPRPPMETFRGARHKITICKQLTEELKTLSGREKVTLFMTLLAAFQTLLARYSQQEDIPVGTIVSAANRPELAGLIGFIVNNLVLRTDFSHHPSFREILGRVRKVTLDAFANQDVPFQKLVEVLRPERHLGYHPLFQVMFVLEPPAPSLESGWTLRPLILNTGTSNMDLMLSLDERAEGLVGYFEYNSDLFDAATIERMAGHFQTVLEAVVKNPEQKIWELPLLTVAEKQQFQIWNDTQADYPLKACLHELFVQQVERSPDAVAVIFDGLQGANPALAYRELNQRANQVAHYLKARGVGPEVLVGICMERSLDMVVGLLGILKAGGAYVPLDPGYPKERLAFMLEDARVPILLTQSHLISSVPSHQGQVICLDSDWSTIAQFSQENPHSQVSSENLAYVIYTSGSTGKPKGAMNSHRGICNRLLWMQQAYQLTDSDRVLQKTPFSFDVSVWEFFWPLITGARLVIAQPGGHQDSSYLVKVIIQYQITTLHFVPSMLQVFLAESKVPACNCIKRIICSGEELPVTLQARCFAVLDAELYNLYGPTETAIDATAWKCQPGSNLSTVPIGRPISNTQIYLLDSHLQPVPVGVPGEIYIAGVGVGRGYLNRPKLTAEKFIPNPFSNSTKAAKNLPSNRLYKTGDLARYLPDGSIEYLGRLDHQVKLRGFRIELGEIEAVLSQHPDVRQAVVVISQTQTTHKQLIAYIVTINYPERVPYRVACAVEFTGVGIAILETEDISVDGVCLVGVADVKIGQPVRLRLQLPGCELEQWLLGSVVWQQDNTAGIKFQLNPSQQELLEHGVRYLLEKQGFLKVWQRNVSGNLRDFLKQKLPEYMIPTSFIILDALPLTPSGKVDRTALLQRSATVVPSVKAEVQRTLTAPRNSIEQTVARVWAEVLKNDQFGIDDNFLDLGGHSLLATQVISRLRSLFQLELPLRLMFECPSIAELARAIAQQCSTAQKVSEPAITSVSRAAYRMKRSVFKKKIDG